jgi:hypothetical protein
MKEPRAEGPSFGGGHRTLIRALASIEGVTESESAFNDSPALWVNGREIAHFEDGGVVDIRLTARLIRSRRAALRSHPSVALRRSSSADWLEVKLNGPHDEQLVLELVAEAAHAHAAAPGTTPGPPATGARLEKMKRFH